MMLPIVLFRTIYQTFLYKFERERRIEVITRGDFFQIFHHGLLLLLFLAPLFPCCNWSFVTLLMGLPPTGFFKAFFTLPPFSSIHMAASSSSWTVIGAPFGFFLEKRVVTLLLDALPTGGMMQKLSATTGSAMAKRRRKCTLGK